MAATRTTYAPWQIKLIFGNQAEVLSHHISQNPGGAEKFRDESSFCQYRGRGASISNYTPPRPFDLRFSRTGLVQPRLVTIPITKPSDPTHIIQAMPRLPFPAMGLKPQLSSAHSATNMRLMCHKGCPPWVPFPAGRGRGYPTFFT